MATTTLTKDRPEYPVVKDMLWGAGRRGMTAREIAEIRSAGDVGGHNRWARPLSELHHAGEIVGLAEKRRRGHVYVDPAFVENRQTWDGSEHHCKTCTCEDR